MKKKIISLFILTVFMMSFVFAENTQKLDIIKLNVPALNKGKSLMQSLKDRKTTRQLSDKKLSLQQLSDLLWACNGVNRDDGKRTAPAALNKQAVDIFVVFSEGVYIYDPVKSQLVPIVSGDYRKLTGMQDFVYNAPVNLIFVYDIAKMADSPNSKYKSSDADKLLMAGIAAGAQIENAGLYCASEGLGSVVRASVDKEKLGKTLKLRTEQSIIIALTVGIPKSD